MKKNLVTTTLALATLSLTACAGVKTRTPADWRADIGQGFSNHSGELRACYESAGLKGKVAVSLRLDVNKYKDKSGAWSAVSVQNEGAAVAPSTLVDCVKRVVATMTVRPEDKKNATGSWVVTFDSAVGGSTGASVDLVPVPKA